MVNEIITGKFIDNIDELIIRVNMLKLLPTFSNVELIDKEVLKPGKADPLLIAIAKQHGYQIVTFESKSGQFAYGSNYVWNWKQNGGPSKHEPKIPDIAEHFGVPCIILLDLEKELRLCI